MRTRILDMLFLIYINVCGVIGSAIIEGKYQCSSNLVTGPHGVNDEQLSASSTLYDDEKFSPKHARLHSTKGWIAYLRIDQYIQVDFHHTNSIVALQTQGMKDYSDRTESYAISYSLDNKIWTFIKNNGSEKIFPGNNDKNTIVTNVLPEVVKANHFRINPRTSNFNPALRFELIGCKDHPGKSWNFHPIVIFDFRESLWNKSASHLGKCATYCYNQATCRSSVFNPDAGTCTGLGQEFLHGYRLDILQGNLYFLESVSLERYTMYLDVGGYTSAENVIYKIYTDQKDITSAQTKCKTDDTDLLVVRNSAVLNTLQGNTNYTQNFKAFVSGSLVNGIWVYSNGVEIPENLWVDGEPSNNNGKCVVLTEAGLKVESCLTQRPFICGF